MNQVVRKSLIVLKWLVLLVPLSIAIGSVSAFFLWSLDAVTSVRLSHPWLLFLLPLGGFLVGLLYHLYGGAANHGKFLNYKYQETSADEVARFPVGCYFREEMDMNPKDVKILRAYYDKYLQQAEEQIPASVSEPPRVVRRVIKQSGAEGAPTPTTTLSRIVRTMPLTAK